MASIGNRFYILGWIYHDGIPTRQDFYIMKTDTLGNKIKDTIIGLPHTYYLPQRIIALSNGHLLITGEQQYVTCINIYAAEDHNFTIFYELDTDLHVVSHWESSDDATTRATGLVEVADGYVYCSLYRSQRVGVDSSSGYVCDIKKINKTNFSSIWENQIYDNRANDGIAMNQLLQTHDGNFIAVGKAFFEKWTSSDSLIYSYQAGYMVKVSATDGSMIWQRFFLGIEGTPYITGNINDIVELSNGDLVGVGVTSYGQNRPFNEQAWILRIDSFGCLIPGCQYPSDISDIDGTAVSWYVAPVPVTTELQMYFDGAGSGYSMELRDMEGRSVQHIDHLHRATTYTLSTESMASGMYIASLIQDGRVIDSRKIVKQ